MKIYKISSLVVILLFLPLSVNAEQNKSEPFSPKNAPDDTQKSKYMLQFIEADKAYDNNDFNEAFQLFTELGKTSYLGQIGISHMRAEGDGVPLPHIRTFSPTAPDWVKDDAGYQEYLRFSGGADNKYSAAEYYNFYVVGPDLEKQLSTSNKYMSYYIGFLLKHGYVLSKGKGFKNMIMGKSAQELTFKLYERSARQGYPKAMHALALMYSAGTYPVKKDPKKALYWIRKSANQGYSKSMIVVSGIYQYGAGIKQSDKKARHWLEQAAAKNNPLAIAKLAELYLNGELVKQDTQRAISLYKKAAAKKNVLAMLWLGILNRDGKGVPQDYSKARTWFEQCTKYDSHNAFCQYELGAFYYGGKGVAENIRKACSYFKEASENGSKPAKTIIDRGSCVKALEQNSQEESEALEEMMYY